MLLNNPYLKQLLILFCKKNSLRRWISRVHTFTHFFFSLQRDATNGRFSYFFYGFFCFCCTIPMGRNKTSFSFNNSLKLVKIVDFCDMIFSKIYCFLKQISLNHVQLVGYKINQFILINFSFI